MTHRSEIKVKLDQDVVLTDKLCFSVLEGKQIVGAGQITKVM